MNTIDQFRLAIESVGLRPPVSIEPGKLQRFSSNGRRADASGWCRLFLDGRVGVFGDFRSGLSSVWAAKDTKPPTLAQRQQRASELQLARAEAATAQALQWAHASARNTTLWAETSPIQADDPVARYLGGRGIHLKTWPTALRYHASLCYWQGGQCIGRFPAMVGAVTDAAGQMVSLHRTYLTLDGSKADVGIVKKLSGSSARLAGCSVKLGHPVAINGKLTIGVAEGIETALACFAASGTPTVSALSANCLQRYQWNHGVKSLIVFSDNDLSQVGQQAAVALAKRAISLGITARVLTPPDSGTDWADVWSQQKGGV